MKFRYITVVALLLMCVFSAGAQDIQSISSDIDRLQADASIDEESRDAAVALLNNARQILARANERSATVQGYASTVATAEQTLRQIRLDLETLQQDVVAELSPGATDSDLTTRLGELSAERTGLDASIRSLRERETSLGSRAGEIVQEIAAARSDLDNLLDNPPAESVPTDQIAAANRTLHAVRLAERRAAIDDLARERTTLAARQEIVAARLDLAIAQSARLTALISQAQERLGSYRGEMARSRLESIEQQLSEFADGPRMLYQYATENVALARANLEMIDSYTSLAVDTNQLQLDLARLTTSTQTVDQVLATGQLNNETAELLRDVRTRLPNEDQLLDATIRADQTIVTLRLNLVLWQDRLRNVIDAGAASDRLLATVDQASLTDVDRRNVSALVDQRRLLLQELTESARNKSDQLGTQRLLRQDILKQTSNLAGLLDRHLLWLPTKSGFGEAFVPNLISNAAWITSPAGWRGTASAVVSGFGSASLGPVILALLALGLGLLKKTIRNRLEVLAARVGKVEIDTYLTTPEALALTLLLTLPWSLGIAAVGLAAMQAGSDGFTSAVAQGVLAMAAVVFILVFLRMLARNNGIFHGHFGWSESARNMLRFNLYWFIAVEAVVAFVFTAALASGDLVIKYGIGRLAFMISGVAIALFAYSFLKPRGGIIMSIDASRQFTPTMKLLFVLLVIAPLIIAILPAVGYYEAAIEVQSRIFESGVVILLAAVIYRISMRIFMVGHQRLIVKQAREIADRELARRNADVAAEQSGDATPKDVDEELADLDAVANQSRRVIFTISLVVLLFGLWGIWGALLPALGIVNDIILWDGVRHVDGVAVSTGISLWDVSVALFLVTAGFVIARNIAGILELIVFERLTLVSGTRYAVTTIARYILISIGIVAGLSRLGLDWSSLQWVIAALGVGLGFGLQEIVANFVSGLIILFERPVRVGDIVTIGELEGTVTSIQIRATRITDFDNREVLMPNKSIITENVTNWTLNDQVTRIILKIGVAYGSDIDRVRELILEAVSSHPDTLMTPAPAIFFMSHGDSSLDFEARVFVATPTKRLPTTHDLNRAINLTLAKNGIEIPFPQRDLHIRDMSAQSAKVVLPSQAT